MIYWVETTSKCTKFEAKDPLDAVGEYLISVEAHYSFAVKVLVHCPDGTSHLIRGHIGYFPGVEGIFTEDITFD